MSLLVKMKREPHAQQLKFINSQAREQLYGGAKRGGKSVAIAMKIILLAFLIPGSRILLARKDFTDLLDTTLKEFWNTVPEDLLNRNYGNGTGHNKGERTISLKTRVEGVYSEVLYRGLGTEAELEKSKGINMSALFIDEPSEIELATFLMLNAQLTWQTFSHFDEDTGKPVMAGTPPYMACLGCNPEPGWVKDRYIDPETRLDPHEFEFIPALPKQNPFLPQGWERGLRATYDQGFIDKYLDGSWAVSEGSVFKMLDGNYHDLTFPIRHLPEAQQRLIVREYLLKNAMVAGLDHGETGTVATQPIGLDPYDNMVVWKEYYEADRLISEHCKDICGLYQEYTPEHITDWRQWFRYILIDPSTAQKTLQAGNQRQAISDAYRNGGAFGAENPLYGIPIIPAWNALDLGIEHLKQLLTLKVGHVHPLTGKAEYPIIDENGVFTGQYGSPSLYFVRSECKHTYKEFADLRKKVTPAGRVIYLGSDHGIDPVRYVANSRPKPAALSGKDRSMMYQQDRFAYDAHQRWAAKFGNTQNTGSYY